MPVQSVETTAAQPKYTQRAIQQIAEMKPVSPTFRLRNAARASARIAKHSPRG